MIRRQNMMEVLLEACPTFRPEWERFLDEWKDEPGEPPLYVSLGDFAEHLISMLREGRSERFLPIFAALERLELEGEHWVREATTIGILEQLQNTNLHSETSPEDFREYLQPETERWWDKLYEFWQEGKLLTDD